MISVYRVFLIVFFDIGDQVSIVQRLKIYRFVFSGVVMMSYNITYLFNKVFVCIQFFKDFPCYEMMVFLSGSVTVTDESGSQTFKAGDVLFASKGSDFTWNITETLRKFYMILEERK